MGVQFLGDHFHKGSLVLGEKVIKDQYFTLVLVIKVSLFPTTTAYLLIGARIYHILDFHILYIRSTLFLNKSMHNP